MHISSLYICLTITALVLPLAISANKANSFVGIGADMGIAGRAPAKPVEKPRPSIPSISTDNDDAEDEFELDDSNGSKQQEPLVLLLNYLRQQTVDTTPNVSTPIAPTINFPSAQQINPNSGDMALFSVIQTSASMSAAILNLSPLLAISPSSMTPPLPNSAILDDPTAIGSISPVDKVSKDRMISADRKSPHSFNYRQKYEDEEPIYCTGPNDHSSSLIVITHPQVPFSKARSLCRSQGMDLALADVSVNNFIEATSLAFHCSGSFSATWVRAYNGDTHQNSCLALFTGAMAPGGSINIPDNCEKHLPTLCKQI
ncbi:hypothetical protein BDF19DRAFT_448966 [Syncephalis fuscata]|nr:hypothetical protein BDF19DRAFT_448966 [Syncephalis fuscata]